MTASAQSFLSTWEASLGVAAEERINVSFTDPATYPAVFAVTDFASASIAAAGTAAVRLANSLGPANANQPGTGLLDPRVQVDRRLASAWFRSTFSPQGWEPAPQWDAIAGNYLARGVFIRLHTNAPAHRNAALAVLGCSPTREAVTEAVASWDADELHTAIVEAGGVAARLRSRDEWAAHSQGMALKTEPLVHSTLAASTTPAERVGTPARPLQGVRVLDLTRVLAGPVATRFLAGLGADVLRIDPLDWNEPGLVPEVNLGKRCAGLDLHQSSDREHFEHLLGQADIFVHGYRPEALKRLGWGTEERRRINLGLVDVSLNAWGWSGPWSARRGFDSVVQVAAGIAHAGMEQYGTAAPKPLPVQALDHAAGHTVAAAALRGWQHRLQSGAGSTWTTSLAAHGELLCAGPTGQPEAHEPTIDEDDYLANLEHTSWGPLRRLRPPLSIPGVRFGWDTPATDHRSTADPRWLNN